MARAGCWSELQPVSVVWTNVRKLFPATRKHYLDGTTVVRIKLMLSVDEWQPRHRVAVLNFQPNYLLKAAQKVLKLGKRGDVLQEAGSLFIRFIISDLKNLQCAFCFIISWYEYYPFSLSLFLARDLSSILYPKSDTMAALTLSLHLQILNQPEVPLFAFTKIRTIPTGCQKIAHGPGNPT